MDDPKKKLPSESPDEQVSSDAISSSLRRVLHEEVPDLIRTTIRDELDLKSLEAQRPLDTSQACMLLNISARKLDQLVASGQLRPLRIGRKRLFPREQLDAFLRRCTK